MDTIYRLIIQSGENPGTIYPIEKPEIFLGRDQVNDIVINDPEVSRRHARFVLQGDDYIIEDLGSTNGSFIRGQRLAAPVVLRPGEMITLGEKVILKYEVQISDPNATVVVRRPQVETTRPPAAVVVPPIPVSIQTPAYPPSTAIPVNSQALITPPIPAGTRKKKSNALVALLIVLAAVVVFCVIPWIIIEVTNSYCAIFPKIFNAIAPGSC
jgi:pSer/pThr/pTyr-binding forkhead associated (FHA) protein